MSRTAESPFKSLMIRQPLVALAPFHLRQQMLQHIPQIAHQRLIHAHNLVHFGGIDLDVNLLGIGRVGLQVSRHPVIEAHAEGQQQIGFLDRLVHPGFPVHAHHAQVKRVLRREPRPARAGSWQWECWLFPQTA